MYYANNIFKDLKMIYSTYDSFLILYSYLQTYFHYSLIQRWFQCPFSAPAGISYSSVLICVAVSPQFLKASQTGKPQSLPHSTINCTSSCKVHNFRKMG